MEKIIDWTQITLESLTTLGQKLMSTLPNILGALVLIIMGWITAHFMSFVTKRALRLLKFQKFTQKFTIDEMMKQAHISLTPIQLIGKFVYWIVLLLFFITATDTLGWAIVSESISNLLVYLPTLFSGIVIFVVGLYIAHFVKRSLKGIFDSMGITTGRFISLFSYYLIIVMVALTALSQIGIDTTILTTNISLLIGGMILAFAVSFGISSRAILTNILSSYYSKNKFQEGQTIVIEDVEGKIEKMDATSCILTTSEGKVVIPTHKLISKKVKIMNT